MGRLNYDTTQDRLYKEFNIFGSVQGVHIVKDTKTGKSRGYAFVEFRDERGAEDAVRRADGRKIDGYKIIVDREFGRTKKGWYPRRLGGGKGEARKNRADEYEIRKLQRELDDEEDARIKKQNAAKGNDLDTPLKIETKPSLEEGQLDPEENPSDEKWRDRKRRDGRRGGRSRSRSHSRSRSPRDRRRDDRRRDDRRDDRRDGRRNDRRDERPYDRRDPRDNDRRPRDSDYDRRKREENNRSTTKRAGGDGEPGEI